MTPESEETKRWIARNYSTTVDGGDEDDGGVSGNRATAAAYNTAKKEVGRQKHVAEKRVVDDARAKQKAQKAAKDTSERRGQEETGRQEGATAKGLISRLKPRPPRHYFLF